MTFHAMAAVCFLTTMTGFAGPALALLIVALGALSAWDRALLRGANSPRAIEIQSSGGAAVLLANGKRIGVRSLGGMGVTRHWVALVPTSLPGRSTMVTAGMAGPENARLLRLWALWGKMPAVAGGQRPA